MSTDASDVTPDSPEDPDQKPKLTLEVQVDSPSTCQRHVTVSVSRDDIDRYCDEAFDELMPQAEVAGFRPGRAPRKLVESRFRDKIAEQVKGTVLMDTMTQVGEECDFSAISEPEFDFDAVDLPDEGPMTFEFNIEVRPEFEMPAWQGLKLDKPTKEVSEDAVKERTKSLLAREGSLTPREGGAELDDIVDANISFSLDGNTLSSIEDQTLVVRPRLSFMDGELDGFDKLIAGKSSGDSIEGTLEISAGAEKEEIRGKQVTVKIDIVNVRFLEIPELNAQFLDKIGGFGNAEELYDIVRSEMERQFSYKQQQDLRKQISKQLTAEADWDLPPALLKRQSNRELERAVMELQSGGFSNEAIRAHANQLRRNLEETTATALKEHFILERIAEENDLEAGPEDFEHEIMMIAMQRNESPRRVRARMEKRGQMDTLRNQIVENKAINLITAEAKITEVPMEESTVDDTYAVEHAIGGATTESSIPEAKHGGDSEELRTPAERG